MTVDDPGAPLAELLAATGAVGPRASHIVTHGAVIVLDDDRAWKLKRPVAYRYLDFSTADLRRRALRSELELNRRTAPQLYLRVHAITRTDDGVELDGDGDVVDWVLEMKRFPDGALLADRAEAGELDDRLLAALADQAVALHTDAEISTDPAGADRILDVVVGNRESMARFGEVLDPVRADELTERQRGLIAAHAELLDRRAARGRVRHGHGDLHLANIALLDAAPGAGERSDSGPVPVPFDCLEFDPELATSDVLYDLAFLLMDLWARGLRHEANVVANAYLDSSPDDEDGFGLLPLLISVRATVRAHVLAAAEDVDESRSYLDLALAVLEPATVRLLAIGGSSGTGKSTIARAVGGDVGAAPGARILRSDVLRKRLAGVGVFDRLPESGYTSEMGARVFGELERLAAIDLDGRMCVIADAVWGTPARRDGIERVARDAGARFTGVWLELDEATRIARIEGRGPDASDATADVARSQTANVVPPEQPWHRIPADDSALAAVRALHTAPDYIGGFRRWPRRGG
ncbi:MAG: AAA family ATPase [Gordonia sp. (in: high G+C Gram-positive bacteria)]|uniref:bifunctional aminoglycoside phosphotransferase/ATP-binding protein n=1 Tax=Gordonia sp. (in: high G+C Gram-positive bacteria) TaxID=84139 RepID=UPI0039E2A23B